MAKIKHTKTELKAQGDALKRFRRFLPMLQLKKQQLQAEIAAITVRHNGVLEQERREHEQLQRWAALFAGSEGVGELVEIERVVTEPGNIAGVPIPVYLETVMQRMEVDLFETPAWYDEAQDAIARLIELRAEAAVLERQRDLVTEELITTSQRVNLFEKVKIPECLENIRVIRIFLGDEQTAAVSRGKIAKSRSAGLSGVAEAGEAAL